MEKSRAGSECRTSNVRMSVKADFHGNRFNPSPAMNYYDNNPINGTTARLAFLTGGPLDSLLAQLAGARVSQPHDTAQLPVNAAGGDAWESARTDPSAKLEAANNP